MGKVWSSRRHLRARDGRWLRVQGENKETIWRPRGRPDCSAIPQVDLYAGRLEPRHRGCSRRPLSRVTRSPRQITPVSKLQRAGRNRGMYAATADRGMADSLRAAIGARHCKGRRADRGRAKAIRRHGSRRAAGAAEERLPADETCHQGATQGPPNERCAARASTYSI